MNVHLPIFTEVLGYNQQIKDLKSILTNETDSDNDYAEGARGYESEEEEEIEEPHGIKGMTL